MKKLAKNKINRKVGYHCHYTGKYRGAQYIDNIVYVI